eukprot:scaffold26564_cov101-Isochrysis_galbana.AAC.2
MYSGEPNGSTTCPFSLQSCGPKRPAAILDSLFSPQKTPPPRYLVPDEMRPPPMSSTAVPVTTGGKIFLRNFGGIMAMPTSSKEATMQARAARLADRRDDHVARDREEGEGGAHNRD